jgi:hypothetical protein
VSSGYREDRRIDAIKAVGLVTRNEASGLADINRERAWETGRDGIADERRKQVDKPKRSFADLVKKKP